jgi:hypothetical protein
MERQVAAISIEPEEQALAQIVPVLRESDLQQLTLDAPEHKSLTSISDTTRRQSIHLIHLPIAIQFLVP